MQTLQISQWVHFEAPGGVALDGVVVKATSDAITVTFPDAKEIPASVAVDSEATLAIRDARGVHSAPVRVEARLEGRDLGLRLKLGGPFESTERREFLRLNAQVPFRYAVVRASHPEASELGSQDAITEDLSAGGLRFLSAVPLTAQDLIEITLPLSDGRTEVIGSARVVRATPIGNGVRVAIDFGELADRAPLIEELFRLQRWNR